MSNNMAAENLEAIVVDDDRIWAYGETTRADAFSIMSHLKLLKLAFVEFSGRLNHLSNELGYLSWHGYPFECLPKSFQPDKLVELSLNWSKIKQLWEDKKPLPNLRRLDLSYSINVIKMPDLGEALNLELLNLEGCISLIKLPHFGKNLNLETLNVKRCMSLKRIDPSIGFLRKLTFLDLEDCRSLIELPYFREDLNLEWLNLERCIQLRQINPSIGLLKKLTFLNLKDCKNLVSLPNSILGLNSLEYLSLSGCSKLQLLHEPRDAEHSKKLCIGEAPIHSHSTLSVMKSLFTWSLNLLHSRAHEDSVSCLLPSSSTFPCLRQLDLSFCNLLQIPDAIGNLSCLERLNLRGNNFAALPNLKELSKLYYLDLQHCKQLKNLPELPSRTNLLQKSYTPPWPTKKSPVWALSLSTIPLPAVREEAGLNIFNCPELVEREHCTMTISWMIQILKVHHRIHLRRYPQLEVSSIIPGSEIPRWFNKQHVGMDSLSSPRMYDLNCMGVMCCVVFGARYGRGTVSAMGPPKRKRRYYGTSIPVLLDEDLVMDTSDHLWLVYLHPYAFATVWGSSLQSEIVSMVWEGFNVEVKKYGYRRIYNKEDLELLNLTMMDSRNSPARKNKILAIEKNK